VATAVEYDLGTGSCTLTLMDSQGAPVFAGVCTTFPVLGSPFPLAPVVDPRKRRELLPVVVTDAFGFGGMNGYLVFDEGELAGRGSPRGFSGHFTYTTTFVPPGTAAWPARWRLGSQSFGVERCVYRGKFRLGRVPIY
jgi:hypothetical protein